MPSPPSGPVPSEQMRAAHWVKRGGAAVGLALLMITSGHAGDSGGGPETRYYSTAAPPVDYEGPTPIQLARLGPEDNDRTTIPRTPAAQPVPPAQTHEPATLAAGPGPRSTTPHSPAASAPELDSIVHAVKLMDDCQTRYEKVRDYTCVFYKRERMADGRMSVQNEMHMKYRQRPASVYMKFVRPTPGREAIHVTGRNNGKAWVHDVGLGKLLAGTLSLDPSGSMAMEGCRHPITDAGIGHMISQIVEAWKLEMRRGETVVAIHPGSRVGNQTCTLIESTHPVKKPTYLFHKVKIYIDKEHGLPIRFEAYDWPKRPGLAGDLLEEYTYDKLRLNVGLTDHDFDPANKQYAFGRF
jgi:Protein of unknown function (DUF1571)